MVNKNKFLSSTYAYLFLAMVLCVTTSHLAFAEDKVVKTKYDNGQLKSEETLDDQGRKKGVSKFYHQNGQLSVEIPYLRDAVHGTRKDYYEDGKIYREAPYDNGRLEGTWKEYTRKGDLAIEKPHVKGRLDGVSKWYYEGGQLKVEVSYVRDQMHGVRKDYYENEKTYRESPYSNGRLEGIWKEYYPTGDLAIEKPHVKGRLDGVSKWYYESGQLKVELPYVRDEMQGLRKDYHENGKLYREALYEKGQIEGVWKEYDVDGVLRQEIPHEKGKRHGLAKWYNEYGELASTAFYTRGELVKSKQSESVNKKTGSKTTTVEHPDGSETVIEKDKDGKVVSTRVISKEDPLKAIKDTLINEGDPQNSAVKKHPYNTDSDEVNEWGKRLTSEYDLSPGDWDKMVQDYFYSGKDNNHHNWKDFEKHVASRALSKKAKQDIDAAKQGLQKLFLVDDKALKVLEDKFHTKGLYDPELVKKKNTDFLGFAVDQLLNGDEKTKALVSDASKQRLSQLAAPAAPAPSIPSIRAWKKGDKKWDCSYNSVLQRMFRADPTFKLKWTMYMGATPTGGIGFVSPSGMVSGPMGGGIAHKRNLLDAGVREAIKRCKENTPFVR